MLVVGVARVGAYLLPMIHSFLDHLVWRWDRLTRMMCVEGESRLESLVVLAADQLLADGLLH